MHNMDCDSCALAASQRASHAAGQVQPDPIAPAGTAAAAVAAGQGLACREGAHQIRAGSGRQRQHIPGGTAQQHFRQRSVCRASRSPQSNTGPTDATLSVVGGFVSLCMCCLGRRCLRCDGTRVAPRDQDGGPSRHQCLHQCTAHRQHSSTPVTAITCTNTLPPLAPTQQPKPSPRPRAAAAAARPAHGCGAPPPTCSGTR